MTHYKTQVLVPCQVVPQPKGAARAIASTLPAQTTAAEGFVPTEQVDLLFMRSILVSTGENKNDDVFIPEEMWNARSTPILKPVDWEHNTGRELTPEEQLLNPGKVVVDNQTIGVMYNTYSVDERGAVIDETKVSAGDFSVPAKFHIVDEAVIWKALYPSVAKRVEAGANDGTLFVSMEAWFTDYNYLVGNKIVARNEETAFLDNTLKANGGSGRYGSTAVKRVLRNLTFGGKGMVARPANEPSIITDVSHQPFGTTASNNQAITNNIICDIQNTKAKQSRRNIQMDQDLNKDKTISLELYTKANEENVELRAEAKNKDAELVKTSAKIAELEAKIQDVTSAFSKGVASIPGLGAEADNPDSFFTVLAEQLAKSVQIEQTLRAELAASQASVAEIELNARTAARKAKVDFLFKKKDEDKPEDEDKKAKKKDKMMAAVKDLSDEQFDALYEVWAEQKTEADKASEIVTPAPATAPVVASVCDEDVAKKLSEVLAGLVPAGTKSGVLDAFMAELGRNGHTASSVREVEAAIAGFREPSDDDNLMAILDGVKASELAPSAGAEVPAGVDLTQSFGGLVNLMLNRDDEKNK